MRSVLTVSQVNFFVKSLIEGDGRLNDIYVTGEISNFTDHYRSGHLYFSLKDEKALLKSVMFSSSARRLKFRPENGMKVIIRGRVSVYEASGQYQLYAEEMEPDGVGALSVAYEQLKNRLRKEGLFDAGRKRPVPRYPERIGVITSPTGAAVRDILQITSRRWPVADIVFCPVLVQGEGAPRQLIGALRALNRLHACDVIILGRGGGSLEDLWAFNDENLARAVVDSQIPVVSAVGHETDDTICDFAADLRAPTPSAAAELCTPNLAEERERLTALQAYFPVKAQHTLEYLRQKVDLLVQDSLVEEAHAFVGDRRDMLGRLTGRLFSRTVEQLETGKSRLALLAGKLDTLSPLKVLERGYSVVFDQCGRVVRDADHLSPGSKITVRLAAGSVTARVLERSGTANGGKENEI